MATRVIMPQGGQDIEVGSVVRWLKKEGDPVKKREVICEVETEKAVFEVEAPEDGFLKKIVVKEGQQTPILSVIGIVGEKDEAISWLERGYEVRGGDMVLLKVGPHWDPLRSDPRFQDLLRRMNFPE